ncbi:MAG: GAF domain-containing protein [Alphaproteobacteria bacterium]
MLDERTADPWQIIAELRRERDEALEQQAAMAEVLQVINRSPSDLAPVFDAILERAVRLCDANSGFLWIYDGKLFRGTTFRGVEPVLEAVLREPFRPHPETGIGRILRGEPAVRMVDVRESEAYQQGDNVHRAAADFGEIRSMLVVPMRRDGPLLGGVTIYRRQVRPFEDRHLALLEGFAAQAAIAMENAQFINETRAALEQQTATAEVLQVINSSPGELQPVFDAMLEKALRLCDASFGVLRTYDGDRLHAAAMRGIPEAYAEFARAPQAIVPGAPSARLKNGKDFVHAPDLREDESYRVNVPAPHALVDLAGARSYLAVALRKDSRFLGMMGLYRQEVRPFSDKQIALLQNFAAQAVIAMENARLINETREALEQQTATAEVLQVINSSPGDLAPVFDTMLERATRLCGAPFGHLMIYADGCFTTVADLGGALAKGLSVRPQEGYALHRLMLGEPFVHVTSVFEDPAYQASPYYREWVERGGIRTFLLVALRKDNALLGMLGVYAREEKPFTDKQIALLQNFAAQAVIAIENARLLNELRDRTRDLQESLEYQTAISDVLKVISQSTFDLQPVLDTLTHTAARLCDADLAMTFHRSGETYRLVSNLGYAKEIEELNHSGLKLTRGHATGRSLLEKRVIHLEDIYADPEYIYLEFTKTSKARTVLAVPLLREGEPVGVMTLSRQRVDAFTERQIELVRTFADQAVITIENARLLNEIRQRQAELRVTFDNMGDGVAMFDAGLRLAAWNRNFQRLLDLPDEFMETRPSLAEYFDYLAKRGEYGSDELEARLRHNIEDPSHEACFERTRPDGRIVEVRRNAVPGGGFVLIYSDVTERKCAEAEIRAARDASEKALSDLKAAQASLLHAQKMSALGQLTAGIAHEIKNPLNFVNNFSALSNELLAELKDMAAPALVALDADTRADIDETIEMLSGNLEKIAEHGRRADNIVKSMLAHSRGSSGERQPIDLNALIDEALNLAYHGARAQDQNFNITMERDFDTSLAPVELVPQDMMRVFLNLIGNGFHAAHKRRQEIADPGFRPVLTLATRDLGDSVEVRVRDNGTGIRPEHRDRLFQPFFTTKPPGEGTGLGLSISYDIVAQEHGGTITVESEPGLFTEFTVRMPRAGRGLAGQTQTADEAIRRTA